MGAISKSKLLSGSTVCTHAGGLVRAAIAESESAHGRLFLSPSTAARLLAGYSESTHSTVCSRWMSRVIGGAAYPVDLEPEPMRPAKGGL